MKRFLIFIMIAVVISPLPLAYPKFYDIYRSDYTKGVFCVAIGGACASDDDPESSFFQNPASLEAGESDFIYDGDFNPSDNLEPGMKVSTDINEATFMGGFARAGHQWGAGIAFSGRSDVVKSNATLFDDQNRPQSVNTKDVNYSILMNFPVAFKLNSHLSFGVSILVNYYHEILTVESSPKSSTTNVDKFPQLGLSIGFIYSASSHFRFGSWIRSPMVYYVEQQLNFNNFSNSFTFDETLGLKFPLIFASGLSIMPWGEKDKRTLLMDIDFIGTTGDGFQRTLDVFTGIANDKPLRSKGRKVAIEPHLGWRSPISHNSKWTYFLGSYWESSRWEGIVGRLHTSLGASYRFSFSEVMAGIDFSRDYFAFGFTFR